MIPDDKKRHWAARPVQAGLIRVFVFLFPIAGSVVFLHFAGRLVPVPTSSFLLFISWWVVMSGSATLVLVAIDRVARRLLPLAALYRLSLVFPDAAPSRFRTAMRSNTAETLEQRVARAKALNDRSTPVEAAERLLSLVAELNSHDRLTRGHSDRVRAYSQLIAKEMRLDSDELELLNWSALLHDVGKLNVPSEILTKAGRPTDEEWDVLRRHPEFGMALVAPIRKWLGEWSAAVAEHHERWDGKGYPKGISGDRIALAARIVAVADVYDVITSARSYKPASASAAARDEIARCAGTQFDPRVVRAFLNVSLGRLRFVMGPLSWLAHAPLLGRLPLTPAIGGAVASLATVTVAVTTGVVGPPPSPAVAATLPTAASEQPSVRPSIRRLMAEDQSILIGVESAAGGASVTSLDVSAPPQVGGVQVTKSHKLMYSPPPNFNGHISVGYNACWRGRGCHAGVVAITVVPVNDKPIARDDAASTRRGAQVAVDVLANDSDPDGDQLAIRSVSDLRSGGRARRAGDRVVWTPARGFLGVATFAYTAADGHGGAERATVTIRVRGARAAPPEGTGGDEPPPGAGDRPPADDPHDPSPPPPSPPPDGSPPQAIEDRVSVPEGGSAMVDVLANDSDPDGDPVSIASVGSPERGTAKQVGDRIQFSAPSNYVGNVSFPYVIADPDGMTDRSRVSVSVLLVNARPTFTSGPDQRVLEDSGAQRVPRWATDISAGPSSEVGQTVSFVVTNGNPALFRAQPEVHPDGSLTYASAPNANGVATVNVRARDNGGAASGGTDTSARLDFTITVKAVNDPPSFTQGADQTVPEDAGSQAVRAWARNIEAGPRDEARQDVTFVVTNGRRALFTSGGQPRVAPDGTLLYTPAANASGSTTVNVRAKDNGGTADGGEDTSPVQRFTITVTPVNDPPSFTGGADQVVPEDSGPQTVAAWATDISPGPADESSQSITFLVSNDNASLFGTQPAVAPNGTLTYAPAANANGVATVSVRAQDDGGGTDATSPQTFKITVTPVNDAPIANPDSVTVAEDSAGVTFDVLANDTDPDAGDTLSVSSYDGSAISNGTLTYNGGGSFTYVPDPAFSGTETLTYVAEDSSGATMSGTVTITVTPVAESPVAGDDAYNTPQDTPLTVAAPGLLSNDGDPDGDSLTVQTTAVSGPANGSVVLGSDGSFTYTPSSGYSGPDSFTYRIDDGTGRSADGVVDITVTSGITIASTLYFQPSGPSADVWDMGPVVAPPAAQLADFDGDGKPGLTIKNSDGSETTTQSTKFQNWAYTAPIPLPLNGPVTLDLWSSTGIFLGIQPGTIYVYLYDCTPGAVSCTRIASNVVFDSPWNTSSLDWTRRLITVGSVNGTIPAGNELHVKVLFSPGDLWMTMSAGYPTALVVTLG